MGTTTKKVRTTPLPQLSVGTWFYEKGEGGIGDPRRHKPFRRITPYAKGDQGLQVMYPDGSWLTVSPCDAKLWACLPIDGPHVTYEQALEAAVEVPKPVPGLRFRHTANGAEFMIVEGTGLSKPRPHVVNLDSGTVNWWGDWDARFREGCIEILSGGES